MVDRAPGGEIEMSGGGFRQQYKGNWKLHMENANDLMHASIVHASSVDAAQSVADDLELKVEISSRNLRFPNAWIGQIRKNSHGLCRHYQVSPKGRITISEAQALLG